MAGCSRCREHPALRWCFLLEVTGHQHPTNRGEHRDTTFRRLGFAMPNMHKRVGTGKGHVLPSHSIYLIWPHTRAEHDRGRVFPRLGTSFQVTLLLPFSDYPVALSFTRGKADLGPSFHHTPLRCQVNRSAES